MELYSAVQSSLESGVGLSIFLEQYAVDLLPGTNEEILSKLYKYLLNEEDQEVLLTFSNAVFVSKALAAAGLFRKALRDKRGSGNAFAIDGAMKFIVPLFYVLGFRNYGPLMHWAYVRTNYRVYPLVKKTLRDTTCVNGQGCDYHIEEDIQRVLRHTKSKDGRQLQVATMRLKYLGDRRYCYRKLLHVYRPNSGINFVNSLNKLNK